MTLEEAIHKHLTTDLGVSALIGARVYPVQLPQKPTLPALSYHKVSDPPRRAFGRKQFGRPRVQFSCWGATYAAAKGLANQVKDALENYAGAMGGEGGVNVRGVFFANELDLYDPPTGFYHVAVDFFIEHVIPST